MELKESTERFEESMKRAASRARELAVALKKPMFNQIAASFDTMRNNGMTLANRKGKSKFEINADIDRHKSHLADKVIH